tara:strand:- start:3908 stop:4084 length:177 start_codon:yes stop_codon:yes gene_type:complete
MAKYYTPKLTEAQYFHVMEAMDCYGTDIYNHEGEPEIKLHERTNKALMKAQEKQHGKA